MRQVVDNSSGITGTMGIFIGKCLPCTPAEWLVLFSICLVLCQLIHWLWRFGRWMRRKSTTYGVID